MVWGNLTASDFGALSSIVANDFFLKYCFCDFPSEYDSSNGNHQSGKPRLFSTQFMDIG
jgi:hypothetical protein